MDRNLLWRFDSKSHTISANFQNSDFDVVGHNDLFIFFTTNDQHASYTPVVNVSKTVEKRTEHKNTDIFGFLDFKFSSFSGTLGALYT